MDLDELIRLMSADKIFTYYKEHEDELKGLYRRKESAPAEEMKPPADAFPMPRQAEQRQEVKRRKSASRGIFAKAAAVLALAVGCCAIGSYINSHKSCGRSDDERPTVTLHVYEKRKTADENAGANSASGAKAAENAEKQRKISSYRNRLSDLTSRLAASGCGEIGGLNDEFIGLVSEIDASIGPEYAHLYSGIEGKVKVKQDECRTTAENYSKIIQTMGNRLKGADCDSLLYADRDAGDMEARLRSEGFAKLADELEAYRSDAAMKMGKCGFDIRFLSQFGVFEMEKTDNNPRADDELHYPEDVAAYGNMIYASDSGKIKVYDPSFNPPKMMMKIDTSSSRSSSKDIKVLNGRIYVADPYDAKIRIFSTDGGRIGEFGDDGTYDGQFKGITGFDIYGGRIYVADSGNSRIQVFSLEGGYEGKIGLGFEPEDIAVSQDRLFVHHGRMIESLSMDGSLLGKFEGDEKEFCINDMEVFGGRIFAPCGYMTKLFVFDTDLNLLRTFPVTKHSSGIGIEGNRIYVSAADYTTEEWMGNSIPKVTALVTYSALTEY